MLKKLFVPGLALVVVVGLCNDPPKYSPDCYKHFIIASSSGEVGRDLSLPIEPLEEPARKRNNRSFLLE